MQKNTAGKWIVFAFDETDNTVVTGDAANITANMRIDGAAANAVDDANPTELEDGYYIFDITAAESNGDLLLLAPQSSTLNVQVIGVPGAVWTRPPNFEALGIESDGDLTQVNQCVANTDMRGTDSASTAAALAVVDANVDAVLIDTGTTLPASLTTIDGNVDAILVDTGTDIPASLVTIDTNVDAVLVDTGTSIPAQITGLNNIAATDIVSAGAINTASGAVANVDLVDVTTTNTDMRGTDGAALSGALATVDANVDAVLVDTGTTIPAQITGLNDVSQAQVNAEVVDALNVDTYGEPGQGAPPATASIAAKVNYLYKQWRNKSTQTSTTYSLFDDTGATVDQKTTVSDDGTTITKGEVATGP